MSVCGRLLPPNNHHCCLSCMTREVVKSGYGNDQFGFRAGSSTTCALISLHDHITKCLDLHDVAGVQVISYDLSKAFDKLRHDVILNRLLDCNLPQSLICWISSYLENRLQFVKIGSVCSQPLGITSGVPQGSILGPFLFSMVMGSLKIQDENCCVIKFADDITVSVPIFKNSENNHIMKLHNTIKNWSSSFRLPLNENKCKCLAIPRSKCFQRVPIPNAQFCEKICILGVTFDAKCSWRSHIDIVSKRASRRLFPLRLLKPYLDHAQLKTVYFALMRSILEYAAPLLVGLTKNEERKLQTVQNRFHRLMCGKECKDDCLPPLDNRRKQQAATYITDFLTKVTFYTDWHVVFQSMGG